MHSSHYNLRTTTQWIILIMIVTWVIHNLIYLFYLIDEQSIQLQKWQLLCTFWFKEEEKDVWKTTHTHTNTNREKDTVTHERARKYAGTRIIWEGACDLKWFCVCNCISWCMMTKAKTTVTATATTTTVAVTTTTATILFSFVHFVSIKN